MDNLLEALKTGSAFNVNREKRDGKRRRAAGGRGLACIYLSFAIFRHFLSFCIFFNFFITKDFSNALCVWCFLFCFLF